VVVVVQKKAKVTKAKLEEVDLVNDIATYDRDYGQFPVTTAEKAAAGTNDFTCGLVWGSGPLSFDNNSNVVAILMDLQTFPNGTQTADYGHVKNSKQNKYLNAKMSGYDPASNDPHPPGGVDNSGVFRDPWGNPYVITMDLSYDDQCSDILYSLGSVSQNGSGPAGFNGLANPNVGSSPNNYLFNGKVMVWSAGPDGKYDTNPANTGVNKDNVLSWQ
jgi:hypothetical protein